MNATYTVAVRLDGHAGSACRLCGIRNRPPDDGLLFLEIRLTTPKSFANLVLGYTNYCIDCYEELRSMAGQDGFKGFPPCYEADYVKEVVVDLPTWLCISAHDAMLLWRKKVDVAVWKQKLAAQRG